MKRHVVVPANSCPAQKMEKAGLLFKPATSAFTITCLLTAYIVFLVFLNKWLFTDLKILSFGKVWQFFISYQEFGFVRRAFLGSLLGPLHSNINIGNEYIFAYAMHNFAGALLFLLLSLLMLRQQGLVRGHVVAIAFSPSIMHFSMNTGSLDIFIFILVILIILYSNNPFVVALATAVGVFVHELMLFYVPYIITLFNIQLRSSTRAHDVLVSSFVGGAAMVAYIVVNIFGVMSMSREVFEQKMALHLPLASGKNAYWSGYFEVTASFAQNVGHTIRYGRQLFVDHNYIWIVVPLTYIFLNITIIIYMRGANSYLKYGHVAAILLPLTLFFIATDYPRWLCISANLGLISVLTGVGSGQLALSPRIVLLLLLFCLVGPFGNADFFTPFPVQQFLFEKLQKAVSHTEAGQGVPPQIAK